MGPSFASFIAVGIPFIGNMSMMSEEKKELKEKTRAANIQWAKQVGISCKRLTTF
jgi:hypothetical protein